MPRVERISKTDLSFLFLDFLGKQTRSVSIRKLYTQHKCGTCSSGRSSGVPWLSLGGRTGKTFWEKTRLRLERCNQSYQVSEAGRSIYRGHRVEERFHGMIRDSFFPHLTSYCLERDAAANSSA